MSAMTSFTLRSLAKNRVRTAVTIAGVALAAALLTGVLTSLTSLMGYMADVEKATYGTWTAKAWESAEEADGAAERAASDAHVADVAVAHDVGFVQNNDQQRNLIGRYLHITSAEGDVSTLCGVRVSDGALPATADEIMLPADLKGTAYLADEPCEVGSRIALDVGQRALYLADGADPAHDIFASGTDGSVPDYQIFSHGSDGKTKGPGDVLNGGDGLRNAPDDGGAYAERITDAQTHTYTVSGFYDGSDALSSPAAGYTLLTGPDETAKGDALVFVETSGFSNMSDLDAHLETLFPDTLVSYHDSLLRSSGVSDERAVWQTVYSIVAVIGLVIAAACVSLIYNAFAISTAERARQFGLLASIGASRRQIRGAVALEAAVIALIGAPLGVLAGVGGTAAVLSALGPSIAQVISSESDVAFSLAVSPAALAVAFAATLATVAVSAWLPARRAGRVSAIDALREARADDGPVSARSLKGTRDIAHLWKPRGIGLNRLFGTPGYLAHLNRKRGRTKGRAASVSLALAVVLLMTAGSLTTYLGIATSAASSAPDYDISLSVTGDAPLSGEGYQAAYETLAAEAGAEGKGWVLTSSAWGGVPADVAGKDLAADNAAYNTDISIVDGDTCWTMLTLAFISDDAFDAWAKSLGADAPDAANDALARGIALRGSYGNDGTTYTYRETIAQPGTVSLLDPAAAAKAADMDGAQFNAVVEDGAPAAQLIDKSGDFLTVPLDKIENAQVPIEIAGVADEAPDIVNEHSETATIILPARALSVLGDDAGHVMFSAGFDAENHAEATEAIQERAATLFAGESGDALYVNAFDVVAEMGTMRMAVTIVNVFSGLFTGILMLIAVANVFNTVSNSLALRRREFAVMKSVGMGAKAFRRMIAAECVGFSIRGLVPGAIISIGVSYLLFKSVEVSVSGIAFTLPWAHIAAAVCLVAIAAATSIAYGLHRSHSSNVVEALRTDIS